MGGFSFECMQHHRTSANCVAIWLLVGSLAPLCLGISMFLQPGIGSKICLCGPHGAKAQRIHVRNASADTTIMHQGKKVTTGVIKGIMCWCFCRITVNGKASRWLSGFCLECRCTYDPGPVMENHSYHLVF